MLDPAKDFSQVMPRLNREMRGARFAPVGGNAISNALWEGVTLKTIIGRASPKTGIVKAAF